jgi:hypothetical protein
MKIKNILSVFTIVMAMFIFFFACRLDSNPEITKAEYTNENTFTVYYIGDIESIPNFRVEGKDKRYNIKSRISITLFDNKVICEIDDNFISGDHITVMSIELLGSAEFDVPNYDKE